MTAPLTLTVTLTHPFSALTLTAVAWEATPQATRSRFRSRSAHGAHALSRSRFPPPFRGGIRERRMTGTNQGRSRPDAMTSTRQVPETPRDKPVPASFLRARMRRRFFDDVPLLDAPEPDPDAKANRLAELERETWPDDSPNRRIWGLGSAQAAEVVEQERQREAVAMSYGLGSPKRVIGLWRCCRCKAALNDHDDAEWHALATGHERVEVTAVDGRRRVVDWRKERCSRAT